MSPVIHVWDTPVRQDHLTETSQASASSSKLPNPESHPAAPPFIGESPVYLVHILRTWDDDRDFMLPPRIRASQPTSPSSRRWPARFRPVNFLKRKGPP